MPSVLEFLDENGFRSYPFLTNTNKTADSGYVLPNSLILDLNLMYTSTLSVFPTNLMYTSSSGGIISFVFSDSITFSVNLSLTGIQYISGTNGSQITINADFLSGIPTGVSNFTNLYVEPSLVHEFSNDWQGVTSLSVETNYISDGLFFYSPQLPLSTQVSPNLVGNIEFYEGYNFGIDFDTTNNKIDLSIGNSYGIPLSCSDQFIDPELTDCSEIVSFINGVPPDSTGTYNISGGVNINLILGSTLSPFYDSINVGEPANTHSLFIGLSLLPSDLCAPLAALPASF